MSVRAWRPLRGSALGTGGTMGYYATCASTWTLWMRAGSCAASTGDDQQGHGAAPAGEVAVPRPGRRPADRVAVREPDRPGGPPLRRRGWRRPCWRRPARCTRSVCSAGPRTSRERWQEAYRNPDRAAAGGPPGPCKEVILKGDDLAALGRAVRVSRSRWSHERLGSAATHDGAVLAHAGHRHGHGHDQRGHLQRRADVAHCARLAACSTARRCACTCRRRAPRGEPLQAAVVFGAVPVVGMTARRRRHTG